MSAPSNIGLNDTVLASSQLHCRRFDDELVMLDLATGQYFSLEGVGVEMWQRLAEGKSPAEIAVALAPAYDAPQDVLGERLLVACRRTAPAGPRGESHEVDA